MGNRHNDVNVISDRHNQQHLCGSLLSKHFMHSQRSREAQSIEMLLIVHAKYGCVFLMSIAQF